jgi:3-isopropylmalate/(R)-2-methylmalate dehydratase small subunit
VELPEDVVQHIMRHAAAGEGYSVTVDLVSQEVVDDRGLRASFSMDPFWRRCIMEGVDEIGLTLRLVDEIVRYEASRPAWMPALTRLK